MTLEELELTIKREYFRKPYAQYVIISKNNWKLLQNTYAIKLTYETNEYIPLGTYCGLNVVIGDIRDDVVILGEQCSMLKNGDEL